MQTYLNDDGDYYTRTGTAATYGLKENAKILISDAKYYLGGMHYDSTGYGTADAIYLWERGTEVFSYETYCAASDMSWSSDWNNRCTTANYCENNPTDEVCTATRSIFWVGEVALMYPSDEYLVYANGVDAVCYGEPYRCYSGLSNNYGAPNLNWIYNINHLQDPKIDWFLSPGSSNSRGVFGVSCFGELEIIGDVSDSHSVLPVLYLSSNVKITEGTGESTNPYKLGL